MNGDESLLLYFDSSALVKLVLDDEVGSDLAEELWNRCSAPIASRLANPEVAAALASAARSGRVRPVRTRALGEKWSRFWSATLTVELTPSICELAARLTGGHALSGADAVHLASALELGDDVVFVTWDRRLHAAASAEGLAVVPATLD